MPLCLPMALSACIMATSPDAVMMGFEKDASPSNASAQAQYICTLATSCMYEGIVIVRFSFSPPSTPPLIFKRVSTYTLPLVSITCQCGAGVSGILKSSDQVNVSLLPDRAWLAVPLLALTPSNLDVVWASPAKPFAAVSIPAAATMEHNPSMNERVACIANLLEYR